MKKFNNVFYVTGELGEKRREAKFLTMALLLSSLTFTPNLVSEKALGCEN
jgi:hypothetical protein